MGGMNQVAQADPGNAARSEDGGVTSSTNIPWVLLGVRRQSSRVRAR